MLSRRAFVAFCPSFCLVFDRFHVSLVEKVLVESSYWVSSNPFRSSLLGSGEPAAPRSAEGLEEADELERRAGLDATGGLSVAFRGPFRAAEACEKLLRSFEEKKKARGHEISALDAKKKALEVSLKGLDLQ